MNAINVRPFELIRNASDIQVKAAPHKSVELIVNDYKHTFSKTHPISRQVHNGVMTLDSVRQQMTGGTFFFVDTDLIEYRDNQYDGVIQTNEGVHALMEHIGTMQPVQRGMHMKSTGTQLGRVWSANDYQIAEYGKGGKMQNRVTFQWSPFQSYIDSTFDVIRLICSNGAVGLTALFGAKVPLINRWQEHLNIASAQIQNKLQSTITERMISMQYERASVADILLLSNHMFKRLKDVDDASQRSDLMSMMNALNLARLPKLENTAIGSTMASHVSAIDAYNILTEMRTHVDSTTSSTDMALDRLSNALLFDGERNRYAVVRSGDLPSPFANPDQAFFGTVKAAA